MLARCVVNEYFNVKEAEIGRLYQKQALEQGFFSNAKLSLIISTGPNSNLVVSIYESEAEANANLPNRQKFFDNLPVKIKDTFMYEGTCEIAKNDLENYKRADTRNDSSSETITLEEKIDKLLALVEILNGKS